MKKFKFKLVSILSVFALCLVITPDAVVEAKSITSVTNVSSDIQEDSYEFLGQADSLSGINTNSTISKSKLDKINSASKPITVMNILPNNVILDWKATENSIILYITNQGIDSVDVVSGSINTGYMTKSFTYAKVKPGKNTYTVTGVPLKRCREDIKISWSAKDGSSSVGSAISTGSRNIPSSLLNTWSVGGRGTRENCLNYHYIKHGGEVGATNICEYVRKAELFRSTTIPNLKLQPVKKVIGATPNVYRYRDAFYYLDVQCINGKPYGELVSFGSIWGQY